MKAKDRKNIINSNINNIEKEIYSRVKLGIKIKFVIATILALSISPPIAVYIQNLISDLSFIPKTIGIYINYAISMIVTVGLLLVMVNRIILKPITQISDVLHRAANGELSMRTELKTNDELQSLGEDLNNMLDKISSIVNKMKYSMKTIEETKTNFDNYANQIGEISATASSLAKESSRGSEGQKSDFIEISQTLVELSSLIQISKSRANQVKQVSSKTNDLAKSGGETIHTSVEEVTKSYENISNTVGIIEELQENSKKLTSLLDQIENIANQTSLLSLNASIESARAGEYGRGFAVVANEIRQLSEEVKKTMDESQLVVNDMINRIGESLKAIHDSSEKIEKDLGVISTTADNFSEIEKAINSVVERSDEIKKVTEEEVASSDQIINLIKNLGSEAETNAKKAREASETIGNQNTLVKEIIDWNNVLGQEIQDLTKSISYFKLKEGKKI